MDQLETERLIIRELNPADRDCCADLLSADFDFYCGPYREDPNIEMRLNWIVSLTNWKSAGGAYGDHAIIKKQAGTLIGLCGIDPWMWKAQIKRKFPALFPEVRDGSPCTSIEFELGYALKESERGKGYATEAVTKLMAWAFEEIEVARILARTSMDNEHSIKMMKRIGMKVCANEEWGGVAGLINNPSP